MIKVHEIKRSIDEYESILLNRLIKKLNVKKEDILSYEIIKESIDARKKPEIYLVYELTVSLKN